MRVYITAETCDICGAVITMDVNGVRPQLADKVFQLHVEWHKKLGQ